MNPAIVRTQEHGLARLALLLTVTISCALHPLRAQTAVSDGGPIAPKGTVLLFTAHAVGFQIYGCGPNVEWTASEPVAALVTDDGQAIRHFKDTSPPVATWEASDGSKVHAVLDNGKPDQSMPSATPNSIPQLGLKAASDGQGFLGHVVYVIRTNTKGGIHPDTACTLPAGKRLPVRYEADYYFFAKP